MDITKLIVAIQRSNIRHDDRAFVVKAVQEYFKTLESAKAIRPKKKEIKKEVAVKTKKES
jgi:hypothetical protein